MAKINVEQAKARVLGTEQTESAFGAKKSQKVNPNTEGFETETENDEIELCDIVNENLFIFKKDDSYILSPADDKLNPVIGEFDEIPENDSMPPCFVEWLNSYSNEIEYFQDNEEELTAEYEDEPETFSNEDLETFANGKMELVDLGLSVKWADMNLGAENPEDFGKYFAWGEIEPKTTYKTSTYKYYDSATKTYTNIGSDISKDEKYDAAYAENKVLCMPTKQQFQELIDKCTWTKTKLNNVDGFNVKGLNGNSIFIPINGCISESSTVSYTKSAYCWTATSVNTKQASTFKTIESGDNTDKPGFYTMMKRTGAAIRPVSSNENTMKETIQPLIPYKWGQSAPYYNQLPLDPTTNKRVVTGCTQTALAMIVAYYGCIGVKGKKYRRGCTKVTSYISKKGTDYQLTLPELPEIACFDYDNFNFIKSSDFKTQQSKDAVAQLMKYLGYANRANYTSSGTGASPTNAMSTAKTKMHLGDDAKMIYASSGLDSFKQQIYDELVNGYPVHFSGWNSNGQSGHAFICDGYNAETGKFHFNWGWNGNYDGWFDISVLKPSSYDFNYSKRCIVGLHPDSSAGDLNEDGVIDITDIMTLVQAILDKKAFDYKNDVNFDGKVNEEDISTLVDYILGKNNN